MHDKTRPRRADLPIAALDEIDGICDRFEAAWEREPRPRIDDYLGGVDEAFRPALLTELLAAELDVLRRRGERPQPHEYQERFPGTIAAIDAAFALARGDAVPGQSPGSGSTLDGGSDGGGTAGQEAGTGMTTGPRYRVLRRHAQGGLGAVFVALDAELHREVALKQILDRHADDPASRARFVLEAEITGGLEHPGIVPVYGLGAYSDGRPFYAMRFIQGDSLKEAIEQFHADLDLKRDAGRRSLEFRQLLRRFLDVCNAIDYAHSRGVLHRDIKPGNVIVGKHGETLVVDWGLAKVRGRDEARADIGERTLNPSSAAGSAETLPGSALGSPAYMSPEQAAGDLDRLGARSDVYSLGATLYSVLTGQRPFMGDAVGEMLRAVQKGEFPPPSKLDPSIDRALEAVCLRAMKLRPADRYATPKALADDVERWMADEPVSARRDPWATRAWRWVRKHRTATTAAAASVAVLLVMVTALAVQQARAADRERRIAGRERQARTAEQAALKLAQFRLGQIEKSNDLLASIFEDLDPRAAEKEGKPLQAILGERLDRAAAQLDADAIGDPLTVAKLQNVLGMTQTNLGNSDKAIAILRRAMRTREARLGPDHPDTLESRNSLGTAYRNAGRLAEAIAMHEETLKLGTARLGADHPDTLSSRNNLATAYRNAGRLSEAIALHEETLKLRTAKLGPNHQDTLLSRNNLATAYRAAGRLADAIALHEETLKLRAATLGPDHPDTLASRNNLAAAYLAAGRLSEAIALHEQALKLSMATLGPDHPGTLEHRANLATAYRAAGRLAEAIALHEEALKARTARLGPDHPDTLLSRNNLATAYRVAGRLAEAIAMYEDTVKLRTARLGPDHPDTVHTRNNLAAAYEEAGRLAEAEALRRDLLDRQRKSSKSQSPDLAAALAAVGQILLRQEKGSEAEPFLRECLAIREHVQPKDWGWFYATSMLGGALLVQGRYAEAEPLVVQGYKGLKARATKIPAHAKPRLAEAAERVVTLYESWGKPSDAAAWRAKLGLADLPAEVFAP